ncbi:transposase [Streptomyces swartbergensis]|uniref:transposase n=1 Tax=Streptomyces swartbergensis TaxID=487165 RepID=UPI00382B164C
MCSHTGRASCLRVSLTSRKPLPVAPAAGQPVVLLCRYLTAPLPEFIAANADWLTVFQLPTYAPDLNPQEGVWSLVKRDLGNLAAAGLGQITQAVKRKLKMLPRWPAGLPRG